jgi:adenylate cyclase
MESYSDVYEGKVTDLQGKVVFVGKANRKFSPGKTDYFQTPFTGTRSGRMAGVEMMATQFSNLLEGRFVESWLPPGLLIVMFGLTVGLLLTQFAGLSGIAASLLVGTAYAGLSVWYFNRSGLWLPVAVPLLIQLPVAWLISLLWSRRDLLNERKRILAFVRRVFPQWILFVPASPGQWYPEKGTTQWTSERNVSGLCLATDIEGYTTVAAHHTPHQMWELLNAYYQVLGHPVSSHDGIIADVTGDAMMAVWIDLPVASQRLGACLAALEMGLAVERFNETSNVGRLPTRIGLHEGDMTLGRLDTGEVSHYRAIGDTVNTASRIQGVNKFLGTRILASAAIAASLINVSCRPVGAFRLVGREEPIELMEIVGMETDISISKYAIYKKFAGGLSAFRQGQWEDAVVSFQSLLDNHGCDGPTRFYLDLAFAYQENPPQEWKGFVTLEAK